MSKTSLAMGGNGDENEPGWKPVLRTRSTIPVTIGNYFFFFATFFLAFFLAAIFFTSDPVLYVRGMLHEKRQVKSISAVCRRNNRVLAIVFFNVMQKVSSRINALCAELVEHFRMRLHVTNEKFRIEDPK